MVSHCNYYHCFNIKCYAMERRMQQIRLILNKLKIFLFLLMVSSIQSYTTFTIPSSSSSGSTNSSSSSSSSVVAVMCVITKTALLCMIVPSE